jgi:cytochrome bd ubiquinol oxidase subunit II
METIWFLIVAFMLTAYVVLDGFDIGAGIIHLIAAKSDDERKMILRSIGPVWDGNEVWLLAAGGTLYFAFPLLYASSFSGFYLPLMMVLWLLMLRAIGVELRSHVESPMWQSFLDVVFSISSLLLAVFFGAAFGNVVRGVPLGADGYFFEPLWTNFVSLTNPGILDWYTVLAGVLALTALCVHGSTYVAHKTTGPVNERAHRIASVTGWILAALTAGSLAVTLAIRPQVLGNYKSRPWGAVFPLLVVVGLGGILHYSRQKRDFRSFAFSTVYLAGMLGGAAFALYPIVLPSASDPALNLTIYNTAAGAHGLTVGLVWWTVGIIIAGGYFVFLYRSFRGKVALEGEGY